jgi:adenylate kinase
MKLIFLGPPGSGKGTYSSRICDQRGWAHISTGDLLRENVKNQTKAGLRAKKYMDRGELVPDDIVIRMLEQRLKEKDCKEGFILDGFPRTIAQAESLDKITSIDLVINLKMPDEVIVDKILARRTCGNCGDIYNVADIWFGPKRKYHMPPVNPKVPGRCDRCGGKLVSRSDETREVIQNRLDVYSRQTEPLIKYYANRGLIRDIDVTGPPQVMIPRILEVIENG